NSRSFHSSNQSYFFFEAINKIKNAFGGEKEKKEYPSNEKDLEKKTQSNLEQQKNDSSSSSSSTSNATAPTLTEEEVKKRENEEYHSFLEKGLKYDYNVFREYLAKFKDQIKEDEKKKEIESFLKIIDCMTPAERENPYIFRKNVFRIRARILKDSNTEIQTFASMVNTFKSAKMINDVLSSFKKQGKPIPNSASEIPGFFKSNSVQIKKEYDKIQAAE
ncbi:hypothetical protein DICPUDRAFT_20838, partial [Dictyostelium purpureum]